MCFGEVGGGSHAREGQTGQPKKHTAPAEGKEGEGGRGGGPARQGKARTPAFLVGEGTKELQQLQLLGREREGADGTTSTTRV